MRRLAHFAIIAGLILAACTDDKPAPPVAAVAEVKVEGQPSAYVHHDQFPPRPPSLVAQLAPEAAWPCEGTGTEGRRVQVLYLHGAGATSLDKLRPNFEAITRQVEGIFAATAADQGGVRLLRYVTGAGCALSIIDLSVSSNALASFDAMVSELRTAGFNSSARIYHAFVAASAFCGLGQVYYDDQPGPGNANNVYAQYSRVDQGCWTATASAHEIGHNLGAVQNSAPNATGASHCRDEYDVMCYPDGGPGGPMSYPCPIAGEDRLDCRADDYFALVPATGSYLATHWNTAGASALSTASGPTSSTTAPPPTTVPPPTTSTTGPTGTTRTTTSLSVPSSITSGVAFTATAAVNGRCDLSGTVAFYVSGNLLSRQVVTLFAASVNITITGGASRPTVRAEFSGSTTCAVSSDSARPRLR